MPSLTSLVTLPARLTIGTVTLLARSGYALASALLREQTEPQPSADGAEMHAAAAVGQTAPAGSDGQAQAVAQFPRERTRPARAADTAVRPEDDGGPVPDLDLDLAGPAAAPPVERPVSEQPEVVAEVAEPGAEDGAGAEVSVEEPLPGYREMKAPDVVDWLETAGAAEVAVTQLYERAHRGRKTVLAAAERRMKAIQNRPG